MLLGRIVVWTCGLGFNLDSFDFHPLHLQSLPQFRQVFTQRSGCCFGFGNNTSLNLALMDSHFDAYRAHLGWRQTQTDHTPVGSQMLKRLTHSLDEFHA